MTRQARVTLKNNQREYSYKLYNVNGINAAYQFAKNSDWRSRIFDERWWEVEMIALDCMGGDHAPDVVVRAALRAAQRLIPIALFGPRDVVIELLQRDDPQWEQYPLQVVHAPEQIAMDDDPVATVRKKTASSLVQAVMSVKEGRCRAVVSAGHSGALLVASTLLLGRQNGIERPAIAGFLPSKKGKVLGLDLGANTEVRPHHLYQFAHLGAAYVERTLGIKRPRIALLANGHEERKGSLLTKEAFGLIKNSDLHFVGNAEPYHLLDHEMDVIVCDGFTGNILLKTCEALADAVSGWFIEGIAKSADTALAQEFAQKGQHNVDTRLDYKQVGGALLLGVNGTVVVCHGNSEEQTLERALDFAWSQVKNEDIFQMEI